MNASAESLARMTPDDVEQLHYLTDDERAAYRYAWRHSATRFSTLYDAGPDLTPAQRPLAAAIMAAARRNQETTP
jgi:hypothetical protein